MRFAKLANLYPPFQRQACQANPAQPGFKDLWFTRHRLLIILVVGLLAFIGLTGPVTAQNPLDAEVDFYIADAEPGQGFTVGDQITLRLEISHPADSRVVLPQVETQWGPFTVVDQTAPQTVDRGDGTAVTSRDFVVTLFQPGDYQTPPLVVTHRQPDGSVEELATPVIPITLVSILTEGDTELRDLKPQIDLPLPVMWPWLVAGLLGTMLLLGLLAGLALWLYHRRRSLVQPQLAPAPVLDLRPPEVIAYAELERIEALNLPAKNQIKEHYSLVATCLRRYIEGRYRVSALEQTTAELKVALRGTTVSQADSIRLLTLVTESDYVKFARYQPRDDETKALILRVRNVIDATTPKPKQPEPTPTLPPSSSGMKEMQV